MAETVVQHVIANGGHLEIIINRPDQRNALNPEVIEGILDILYQYRQNPEIKTVTMKSNGDVFCSGADIKMMKDMQAQSSMENLEDSRRIANLFHTLYVYPKPVIAAVQGPAIAGGFGLATVCDFIIAVEDATFSYPEVRIGFVPAIVSVFLLRKVGEAVANDLLLTGQTLSADEAWELGLVREVVTSETLQTAVNTFRNDLVESVSMTAYRLTKDMIKQAQSPGLEEALQVAASMNAFARQTDDCREGMAAFIEKRKPNFLS